MKSTGDTDRNRSMITVGSNIEPITILIYIGSKPMDYVNVVHRPYMCHLSYLAFFGLLPIRTICEGMGTYMSRGGGIWLDTLKEYKRELD